MKTKTIKTTQNAQLDINVEWWNSEFTDNPYLALVQPSGLPDNHSDNVFVNPDQALKLAMQLIKFYNKYGAK